MSTAFEELAQCLEQAEEWSSRLPEASAEQMLNVITGLDRARELVDSLVETGARYPAEELQRIETIESFLRRHLRKATRTLERSGVSLETVAAERARLPDAWWWRLPELAREQRQQAVRRWLTMGGIALVVIVVVVVLLRTVLAPDPLVATRMDALEAAQRALFEENDPERALEVTDEGLAKIEEILERRDDSDVSANTIELWTLRGVILELLERPQEAAESFAKAEAQDAWSMLAYRVGMYRYLGNGEAALDDALALIELDPEHPAGYMLLGDVQAWNFNNLPAADQAYAQAEVLAFNNDKYAEIYVLVRQRRYQLQQQMFMLPLPTEQSTEEP